MVIYNLISTILLSLMVLLSLCILVLRVFNRRKLVKKYFEDIEGTVHLYSFINMVCILGDIHMDNEFTHKTLCGTLMSIYIGSIFLAFAACMIYIAYQRTKNIRSKFKDY